MFAFNFWRILAWQRVIVAGLLVCSLFIFSSLVLAQDQDNEPSAVSEEVKAEVEEQLTTSAEAVKDTEVDVKQELDLPADFDPMVPNNFINSIGYGFKKFGRNVQKAAYKAFASDQKEAGLIKKQADKALAEAVKLQALDPDNEKVVGIVDDYKSKLAEAKEKIGKIKDKDSTFAKDLAAEIAEDNLFVAPKVLSQIQENLLARRPEAVPDFVRTKEQALAVAADAVLQASDSQEEAADTLKILAFKHFKTPFSGIAAADALAQAKEHLPDELQTPFDEVIKASLDDVENNIKNINIPDELKAQTFQRYVEQLPGPGLSRLKVMEQFRSSADLPPVMIEKMNEMKARIAEQMSKKIEEAPSEQTRKALTEAMFKFQAGKIEDLKLMNEVKDIVPSQEIREHMKQKHEESVNKFLTKFGDDQNARAVTEEFQALNRKVGSGEITPDANFFKTLEGLKSRLSPDQQKFISETEEVGKQEMAQRMKQDSNFASRFSSFNPADVEYLEKFKGELEGEVVDFESKFREIERQQSENFRKLLDVQDDPDKVREFKQHFEQEIPEEIKQRFESRYEFKFEDQYQKFESRAREREEFFQEKLGKEFPGQQQFPGQGFGTQKPRLIGPPVCADGTVKSDYGCEIKFEKKNFDPSSFCTQKGGVWKDSFCEFENRRLPGFQAPQDKENRPEEAKRLPEQGGDLSTPKREEFSPERFCLQKGGTWTGAFCQMPNQESSPQEPMPSSEPFKSPTAEQPPPEGDIHGAYIETYPDIFKALFDLMSRR